ncbi:Stress-responsive transcription regulator [Bombilactobacillus mellifer]|uniref:Stress-responsive transcription regulator n=1 Tax=Bombilactobacillus mellifer TaxID=1218492 RepID=A0A0F4LVC6_9LACO|nr:PspC domain-containing protein [Bombilactobacillus mellifer]KJY62328.1 Stress-responsive transcription regulator [Bombilactobacillus mellifer]
MKIPIERSHTDRYLAGVVGGLAAHFDWNSNLLRVIFIVLALTPGFPGILVYLVLWLLMK